MKIHEDVQSRALGRKETNSLLQVETSRNGATAHGSRTTAAEPAFEEITNGATDPARIQEWEHVGEHGRQSQEDQENTDTDGHPFDDVTHLAFR